MVYVREPHVRYRKRCVPGRGLPTRLAGPQDAAHVLAPLLRHEAVEVCGILCLSVRYDILAYHELSRGTLDATFVHPRELFRAALLANARAIIVGHNHPSGDPSPSPEDIELALRLKLAGDFMGVTLIDSLIIGDDRTTSLADLGLI